MQNSEQSLKYYLNINARNLWFFRKDHNRSCISPLLVLSRFHANSMPLSGQDSPHLRSVHARRSIGLAFSLLTYNFLVFEKTILVKSPFSKNISKEKQVMTPQVNLSIVSQISCLSNPHFRIKIHSGFKVTGHFSIELIPSLAE